LENRNQVTLTEKIRRFVAPGTLIVTDGWRGYNSDILLEFGYEHQKVKYFKIKLKLFDFLIFFLLAGYS
jgi:hypothetical protein